MATTTSAIASVLKGLAHGGAYRDEGESVKIELDQNGILLSSANGRTQKILYDQLNIAFGGFNDQQAILSWVDFGKNASVMADAMALRKALAEVPDSVAPHLKQTLSGGIRTVSRRRKVNMALVVAIVGLPLFLIAAFIWKSDSVVQWLVDRVSIESEQKMGDLLFEQTQSQLTLVNEGELPRVIEDIGERLAKGTEYNFTWHVAKDDTINAFAMPGGHVVVYTGLIAAAESSEEVAGVLAHEIQHVLQRHSLKAMVKNLGWRATLSIALGDWSGGVVGDLAGQLGELRFSRDAETEADMKGLETLRKAALDPNGMVTFFEKLSKQEGVPITLLSTHPASADRMSKLKQEIEKNPPVLIQSLPYDWSTVKQLANR